MGNELLPANDDRHSELANSELTMQMTPRESASEVLLVWSLVLLTVMACVAFAVRNWP